MPSVRTPGALCVGVGAPPKLLVTSRQALRTHRQGRHASKHCIDRYVRTCVCMRRLCTPCPAVGREAQRRARAWTGTISLGPVPCARGTLAHTSDSYHLCQLICATSTSGPPITIVPCRPPTYPILSARLQDPRAWAALARCPNLTVLSLGTVGTGDADDNALPAPGSLASLRRLRLGAAVLPGTLLRLLQAAPGLEELTVEVGTCVHACTRAQERVRVCTTPQMDGRARACMSACSYWLEALIISSALYTCTGAAYTRLGD